MFVVKTAGSDGKLRNENKGEEISVMVQRHGTSRTVSCREGFADAGGQDDQKITCRDGKWTPLQLDCQAFCSPFKLPTTRGDLQITNQGEAYKGFGANSPKSFIEVSCSKGTGPVGGPASEKLFCLGGEWDIPSIRCGPLCPGLADFAFTKKNQVEGERYSIAWGGNHPNTYTTVTCMPGFAPLRRVDVASGNMTAVQSINAYCMDGKFEDIDFSCKKTCTTPVLPAPQASLVFGENGADSGLEHGATRTVQCADGYMPLKNDISSQEITCIDGEWTPVSISCLPSCPLEAVGFHLCDWSDESKSCTSPYELQWHGANGTEVASTSWIYEERIRAGEALQVRCNEGLGFKPTDGTANSWVEVRCQGTHSGVAGVEAFSWYARECERSCLAGDLNLGPAYKVKVRVPENSVLFSSWLSIEQAARRVGWVPDAALVGGVPSDNSTSASLIQQKALDGKVNLMALAARLHPSYQHHVELARRALQKGTKAATHPQGVQIQRQLETSYLQRRVAIGSAVPYRARSTLNSERARLTYLSQLPKDKQTFTGAVAFVQLAARNKRHLAAAFPQAEAYTKAHEGKRRTISRLGDLIQRTFEEKKNHPVFIQTAAKMGVESKLLPMAKIIIDTLVAEGKNNPVIDPVAEGLGCVNNYTLFGEIFPENTIYAALTCDILLTETRPKAWDVIEAEFNERRPEADASVFHSFNWTREEACATTITGMLARLGAFPDNGYSFNPDLTHVGDICGLSCGAPYCPAVNRTGLTQDEINHDVNIKLAMSSFTPQTCVDVDALPNAFLPGATCPYISAMYLKATKSRALKMPVEGCEMRFMDVLVAAGAYDPDLGLVDMDFKYKDVCNFQCSSCPYEDLTQNLSNEDDYEEWEPSDPFADQPWFNALFPYGTEAEVSCAPGFTKSVLIEGKAVGDSEVLTCLGSEFSVRSFQCAPSCPGYRAPSGNYIAEGNGVSSEPVEFGSKVWLSCAEGSWGLNGMAGEELVCIDGSWTFSTLTCVRSCDPLQLPASLDALEVFPDASSSPANPEDPYSHGGSVLYGCKEELGVESYSPVPMLTENGTLPYSYVSEDRERVTCVNGGWTPLTLMCKRDCPAPQIPVLARYRMHVDGWEDMFVYDEDGIEHVRILTQSEVEAKIPSISRRHGSEYRIYCKDETLTAAEGPMSGFDTIRCLDGQWTRQTLVCKYRCPEFFPRAEDREVSRFKITPYEPDVDFPYLDGNLTVPHSTMRRVNCNEEKDYLPNSALQEQSLTCNDGHWDILHLDCKKACQPMLPAIGFEYNPMVHFPPVGFCIWDKNNKVCDTPTGLKVRHNEQSLIACADDYAPVQGNVPITVTCEDGIYSNVYVQCAPVCLFSSIIFGDNQVPKCYTKAAAVLDHAAVAAEVKAAHEAAEREALEKLYQKPSSFIQAKAHATRASASFTRVTSTTTQRSIAEKHADSFYFDTDGTTVISNTGTQWSANAQKWVKIEEEETGDKFKTVAMVKPFERANVTDIPYEFNALTPSCSGQTKAMKFRKLPLDHGSEITYKCVEGSDPFGDIGYSNTSDCIWGEWTARGLQCKKRCSINTLKQQITHRKGGKFYKITNDLYTDETWPHEWFVRSGEQVTLSCAVNTTAWPQNIESDGTEKLRCDDGEWEMPTIVCMKDCELHPLEEESWLYAVAYADTGSKTHGAVAEVSCVDGAYPGKVDASIYQPSECVDGQWQPLGYPCFLGCPIVPQPNVFYRSARDYDEKFVNELKSALSDEGTLLSHGHEFLLSCNAGYTRGVNFVDWAPVTPDHIVTVLPPREWIAKEESARIAWATADRATLEAQFSYEKAQCNAGVISQQIACYKSCSDPRDSVLRWQLERLLSHEIDGNTKEWRDNFKDFPEIWPHDSEYRVECDETRGYMNTGVDIHQVFTLKCRDGVWDIPKIACRKACPSLEETQLGQEILNAGVYEFYGRAPRYLMELTDEETEIKGSLALGKENYRVHGATYNLQCRPAYTPIHLDKTGAQMPGIWEGDEIVKAKLTSRAYSNLKHFAGMDQWGFAAKGSRSSAGDEYDALLEQFIAESTGAKDQPDNGNSEEKSYDRQYHRDQIKCVNGDWVGFEMKCVPKCAEFLHPENEFMQAKRKQSAYRVYELSEEELYMVDTSEPTKGKEVKQNVGTKRSNPYVVSGTRRMVTCAKGYTPLSVKGTFINSDGEYFGLATCQAGRWLNSALVCSKDCDEPYTNVLYRKCLAWHNTYNSSPCSQFKAAGHDSRANCAVAHCGERKTDSKGSYEGGEGLSVPSYHSSGGATNSTMTPYVIYRTAVRRAIEVEEEEGQDTRHFAGVLGKQAGTVHVVACNVNQQFAIATRMLSPVYTDSPLARDGVALVTCFDGKWTDVPFFCDKACMGSFDLYAAPHFWIPVFSSKIHGSVAPLNPIVQGLMRQSGGWTAVTPTMDSYDYGIGFPTEPDTAFAASSSLRRIPDDFVVVGPYSGGVSHQEMELTWPMKHVWRIHGPGACDSKDGWKEREGDCINRLYGRGSWVTYESLIGQQNYYSICAPGAKQISTNYRLDGSAARFGRLMTLFWSNAIDSKANSYEMGWTDPRLPVLSPHLNSRAVWHVTLAGMRDASKKDDSG